MNDFRTPSRWQKRVFLFVAITLVASIVFISISMALADTMKDLIVDTIGAAVMSVIGYVSLKYQKGWVEKLLLKRRHHHG